ncbi:MAG: hypothetical protein GF329_17955, partial [Candidatus Lokiarchaeota archaeon]|nr:hypothetical protein [Candidatus Lokiarchaeota archaeon]
METNKINIKLEIPAFKINEIVVNLLNENKGDIKDIIISEDEKYLISCSETLQDEQPYVVLWRVNKIIEGIKNFDRKLYVSKSYNENNNKKYTNWLLCLDSFNLVNDIGKEFWIISAGTISGEIILWWGEINEYSKEWDLKNVYTKTISIEDKNYDTNENNPNNNEKSNYFKNIQIMAIQDVMIVDRKLPQEKYFHIYVFLNNLSIVGALSRQNIIMELPFEMNQNDI